MSDWHPIVLYLLALFGLYIVLQLGAALLSYLRGEGDGRPEVEDLGFAPPRGEEPQPEVPNLSAQASSAPDPTEQKWYRRPRRRLPGPEPLQLPPAPCKHCGKRVVPQTDGTCGNCGAPRQ